MKIRSSQFFQAPDHLLFLQRRLPCFLYFFPSDGSGNLVHCPEGMLVCHGFQDQLRRFTDDQTGGHLHRDGLFSC